LNPTLRISLFRWLGLAALLSLGFSRDGRAQEGEAPIDVFGYFQNVFQWELLEGGADNNTFAAQQLNLFFQKDLAPRFRSFVNFEFLNTFSSSESWGAANLKEAWVRYDAGPSAKLKMGLQTPVFNHLNEIKTRTPLLPYIIRPIVYETSLEDVILQDEYVPERGFFQFYGTMPLGSQSDFDYALFAGNSPNIRSDRRQGQTGVDTTENVMVGGRVGVRMNDVLGAIPEVKLGLSGARDRVNYFRGVWRLIGVPEEEADAFREKVTLVPRTRLGIDLAFYFDRFYIESEGIMAFFDVTDDLLNLDRAFGYATLGVQLGERLESYVSYWRTDEDAFIVDRPETPITSLVQRATLDIPTVGAKWTANDRVVFKVQAARVDLRRTDRLTSVIGIAGPTTTRADQKLWVLAIGASVFF
jgi:hypothetical protein